VDKDNPDQQEAVFKLEVMGVEAKYHSGAMYCCGGALNSLPGTYSGNSYQSPLVLGYQGSTKDEDTTWEGIGYIDAILDQIESGGKPGEWQLQGYSGFGTNLKEMPAYRWSGRMRLYVQAIHGTNRRMDAIDSVFYQAYDKMGLLISDDYRFYVANIFTASQVGIIPLVPVDPKDEKNKKYMACELELLRSGKLDEDAQAAVLTQVLATLKPDPDEEHGYSFEYTDTFYEGAAPGIYQWHWSYTENKAAICCWIEDWENATFDTKLYELVFEIPPADAEADGAKITASLRVVEEGHGIDRKSVV
jgi:hypothetical protein